MRCIVNKVTKLLKRNDQFLFVSFSETLWDGPWYVRQKLMNELAKDYKVIYVNPRKDLRVILHNMKEGKFITGIRKYGNNIILIESPWLFPKIYRFPLIDSIVDKIYHMCIKILMLYYGFNKIKILYIWESTFSNMIKYYGNIPYVYHVYDLLSAYTYAKKHPSMEIPECDDNTRQAKIQKAEKQLVENALLLYAVSDNLCDYYLEKYKRRPILFPNGVSEEYFIKNVSYTKKNIINKLELLGNKKIAYVGSVIGSLDLDIVIESTQYLKDYSFAFIGPIRYTGYSEYDRKIKELLNIDNVYYLGMLPVEELPYILREMDILLLLYSQDKSIWTYYSFPAKLYEYFALGLPIISTPHPVIKNYSKYISIVDSPEKFVSAVLSSSKKYFYSYEVEKIARENLWTNRKISLIHDIKASLARKEV